MAQLAIGTPDGTKFVRDDGTLVVPSGGGGGITKPMTTAGDIIKGGTAGAAVRLAIGTAGQVLTAGATAPAWATQYATIAAVIDGGGSVITTGTKGMIPVDFPCVIESATLLAEQSGSIVVDVWKTTYAGAPPAVEVASSTFSAERLVTPDQDDGCPGR